MKNNRLEDVLDSCHNYDEIISYNIKDNDEISRSLINYYEDFVFLNFDDKNKINKLDLILYEYIKDRNFYKFIQERFKSEGDVLPVFDELKNLYDEFKEETLKKVESAVWI